MTVAAEAELTARPNIRETDKAQTRELLAIGHLEAAAKSYITLSVAQLCAKSCGVFRQQPHRSSSAHVVTHIAHQ
jgi:hypothetical protein